MKLYVHSPFSIVFLTNPIQATVAMCALVAFSFYWIRRQQYELFLILHIVLSIIVLLTMLGYVCSFKGPAQH